MSAIRWWHWIPWPFWRLVAIVEAADEIPERVPRRGVLLVGTHVQPKWLAFDCPCGSGHRVMINLDANRRPCWRFLGSRLLTISPSVDSCMADHRCHYLITRGRVVWVS